MTNTVLDDWLRQATRCLANDSAAQVRAEIQEHYQSAREDAVRAGASAAEADRSALTSLGDAATANRQYRRVLLTSAEAKMLSQGNREARAVCGRPWLKRLVAAMPAVTVMAATALLFAGRVAIARDLLIFAIAGRILLSAGTLAVYTRLGGRIFRLVKWVAITGALALIFGSDALKWSWLLLSCLWPMVWTEWTRASIRRKLPIAAWPKHLYL
jgi:hypothetical protein